MTMIEENHNGHHTEEEIVEEAFKGAHLNLNELKREDGLLTRGGPNYQSLLHRAISAIQKNEEYRQELKTALFANSDEADNAVSALEECFELGLDATPIIDQIIARSAGKNHEMLFKALDTLTHSTFTTNYQGRNNGNGNKKTGPLGS